MIISSETTPLCYLVFIYYTRNLEATFKQSHNPAPISHVWITRVVVFKYYFRPLLRDLSWSPAFASPSAGTASETPRGIMVALHRCYILTYAKHSIDYRFSRCFASTLDEAALCTEILEAATHCICEILLLMHELVVAHSHRLELDVHCVRISLFI